MTHHNRIQDATEYREGDDLAKRLGFETAAAAFKISHLSVAEPSRKTARVIEELASPPRFTAPLMR
jgi:hypothetical protein